jgi:NAD(P)-dependent dehydrogenase (short-subunit alcohol dehydrogenase family)
MPSTAGPPTSPPGEPVPVSALSGGVAVVTGGGSGLGAAMARAFAGEGMRLAVLDINREAAEMVAAQLVEAGAETIGRAVDVADRASLDAAAAEVTDRFGACNVVAANVGVMQFGPLEQITADDWQWLLSVNVVGTANTVNAFLPLLRASDGPRRILLTSSMAALVPSPRQGAYITTKFAITGYGEVLRQELADDDIGVTIVFPSGMMTAHLDSSRAARPRALGESVLRDEDLEVVVATAGTGDDVVTTPEDAITDLVHDVLAGEPYFITHGSRAVEIRARHQAIEDAHQRMREARDRRAAEREAR